jgi:hypothetical protein
VNRNEPRDEPRAGQLDGKVAFRPAIVNSQTPERDVDLLFDVLLALPRR